MASIDGEIKSPLKDFYGDLLHEGFYLQRGDPGNILRINLSRDGKEFTAINHMGEIYNSKIYVLKEPFTTQLVPLRDVSKNLEFVLSNISYEDREAILKKFDIFREFGVDNHA